MSNEIPQALDGTRPYDFPNIYFAGRRIIEARAVYDDLALEVNQALGWKYDVYPADTPLALSILTPLTFLPYKISWGLFAFISWLSATAAILILAQSLKLARSLTLISLGLFYVSMPFRFLIAYNHFESLILLSGTLGYVMLKRDTTKRFAGCLWGFSAALKLFPTLWIAALIRRRYDCFIAIASFLGASLLGAWMIGFDNAKIFVVEVIARSDRWLATVGNYSLISFGRSLHYQALALTCAAVVLLATFLKIALKPQPIERQWSLLIVASLLVSPLCWLNYLILLMPLFLFRLSLQNSGRAHLRELLIAMPIFFWPALIQGETALQSAIFSMLPLYAMIFLWLRELLES